MKSLMEVENNCIDHLNIDYMPLHDVVREFSGFEKLVPSEEEFYQSMDFLENLIKKHNLKYSFGAGGELIDMPLHEFVLWLKNEWRKNAYDDINYGVWLAL
jgi:hypothetical protein